MIRVLLAVNQDPEPGPDQGLVVGEQDPDHTVVPSMEAALLSRPWTGKRAVTW